MNKLFLILLILCVVSPLGAQKILQLEQAGKLRSTRFYIGDEITFQLKNDDKGWYTRPIIDMDVSNNLLILHDYMLSLDSIAMIGLPRGNVMQIVGGALQVGGVNMILFSTYYSIFRDQDTDWTTMISGAANIGIGTLLRKIRRTKKFKPGKRKRLRLLDLSFGPPVTEKS